MQLPSPDKRFARQAIFVLLAIYVVGFAPVWALIFALTSISWTAVVAVLGFAALLFWIQFRVSTWVVNRMTRARWVGVRGLTPASSTFMRRLCETAGVPEPKLGVSPSRLPNAYTFGRRSKPVVIVTEGLLDLLQPDELNAVLAHEMGHVYHGDFVLVTMAALVPMFLGQAMWRCFHSGSGQAKTAFTAFGIVLGVMYVFSEKLMLFLSRGREYGADAFAAATVGDPNLLSLALLKIGSNAAELRDAPPRYEGRTKAEVKSARAAESSVRAAAVIGFMGGAGLAAAALPGSGHLSLNWELRNPWARWKEVFSTHPLTARRIERLNKIASRMGHKPIIDLAEHRSDPRAFAIELAAWTLPWPLGFATYMMVARGSIKHLVVVLLFVISMLVRLWLRYPRTGAAMNASGMLASDVASPVRALRVQTAGVLRAAAGSAGTGNLVLDNGGSTVKLRLPFTAAFKQRALANLLEQRVEVDGWFRRLPEPVLQVRALGVANDRLTFAAPARAMVLALTVFTVFISIFWAIDALSGQ